MSYFSKSKRLPSSAISFIKTKVCQYKISRAVAGAGAFVLLVGLGYISPDSKLEGIGQNPSDLRSKNAKRLPSSGQAMAQFVLKIEKLSHIMGPTPILEMAHAYGLRPRLSLLLKYSLHTFCSPPETNHFFNGLSTSFHNIKCRRSHTFFKAIDIFRKPLRCPLHFFRSPPQ